MSGLRARTSSFQDLMTGVTTAPEPRARFESDGVPANEESRRELMWTLMSSYLPRDVNSIERYIVNHIEYTLARTRYNFDSYAAYQATAYSVRDRLIESFNDTQQWFDQKDPKRIYYLSLEFLMGRTLHNALSNLGLKDKYTEALRNLGFRLEDMYDMEKDAALGNGGLGRLAACFMDSLATHNYPGWGYGIRYKYGMFAQKIVDGFQVETPDIWLTNGNPWEIQRLDVVYPVRFYGSVSNIRGKQVWEGGEIVDAVAYDNPIPGYDTYNTNNIRLWSGKPAKEFDLASFNEGDYIRAIEAKQRSEDISAVLYPNDNTEAGKELRLRQQFFFVSATLQDVIRRFKGETGGKKHNWNDFPEKVAVQLNDTHPTLGISELMRQLMDLEGMAWDEAWKIVYNTFGYTNHTVMPEALEKWSVPLMSHLLPRHIQIIFEINYRFLQAVEKKWPGDWNRLAKMSIIEESSPKMVRMAVLAVVGSHAVNGVAAIHSELVKTNLFPEFVQFYGDKKFSNKTNGVTPRRWLLQCNPGLAAIISKWLGSTQWVANLGQLSGLKKFADNPDLQKEFSDAKRENKERLANLIYKMNGVKVRPDALFDVQVKRIHEYKRQLLNILQVIHRYNRIKRASLQERSRMQPRVCIFGGKAAPGYWAAKMIIRLITGVGKVVNDDKDVGDLLKVVFLANYNVSLAEVIIPANDISEHISTAGTEASGTSNMKFVLNGGLIVGTMDGANIEIREEVGDRNIFIFGCLTPEVEGLRHKMRFERPKLDHRMDEVLNQISAGKFGPADKFQFLVDNLRNGGDTYLLGHDFPSYVAAQDEVDKCFQNRTDWVKRTIEAVSGMGKFSSDRTIHEYCAEIWNVPACAYTPPDNMTFRKPHWSDSVEANLSNMA